MGGGLEFRLQSLLGLVLLARQSKQRREVATMVKTRCSRQGHSVERGRGFFLPNRECILPNRECIEAKIEVTVRNGEVTFTLKELETVPGAIKSGGGKEKLRTS